jgi:hypothetical protein
MLSGELQTDSVGVDTRGEERFGLGRVHLCSRSGRGLSFDSSGIEPLLRAGNSYSICLGLSPWFGTWLLRLIGTMEKVGTVRRPRPTQFIL